MDPSERVGCRWNGCGCNDIVLLKFCSDDILMDDNDNALFILTNLQDTDCCKRWYECIISTFRKASNTGCELMICFDRT